MAISCIYKVRTFWFFPLSRSHFQELCVQYFQAPATEFGFYHGLIDFELRVDFEIGSEERLLEGRKFMRVILQACQISSRLFIFVFLSIS